MKTLYILRHAKASTDHLDLEDFERPLTPRGKRDAAFMADVIRKTVDAPVQIVSSSALRAVTTARIFSEGLGIPSDAMMITNALYDAATRDAVNIIHGLDGSKGPSADIPIPSTVVLVGHNPTLSSLVNYLTIQTNHSQSPMVELPTCGCVKLVFADATNWSEIERGTGTLVLFEYPKKYLTD